MKKRTFLKDYAHIAEIHAVRLKESLERTCALMPLTANQLSKCDGSEIAFGVRKAL